MKKTIAIIILSVLLFISIGISILSVYLNRNNQTKLTKANDEKLVELKYELESRDKEIKRLKDNPEIKIEEKVIIQEKIIEKDTEIIKDLKFRLDETNTKLKKRFIPKHSLSAFALIGLDNTLTYDLYVGVTYRRMFFDGKFFVGGGAFVKPMKNVGAGVSLEIGITF
jgi:hypothetical protein